MVVKRLYFGLIALLFSLNGCGELFESPEEKTVITVGKREISIGELKKDIKRFTSEMGITEQGVEQVLEPLVNRIIDHYLILEYGRENGIFISEEDLEAAVKKMERDYSEQDLRKILLHGYIDYDEWKMGLKEHLLVKKIMAKASESIPPVSHQEIKMYFNSHPDEFRRPIMVRFRQIVLADKAEAEKIWRRLKMGEDMEQLAREHSIAPEADNGGEVGWVAEEHLEVSMSKVIFSLPIGKISPVVKTVHGFHIFKVLAKRPAGIKSLPEAITEIESKLNYQKEAQFYKKWLQELKTTYPVDIKKRPSEKPGVGMMKLPKRIRIFLFLVMIALLGFHHAHGETLNRVVAIVNDDIVTLYELNRKIKELTGRTPVELKALNEERYFETRSQILELLINDKITEGKIKEMGINVTQEEVDKAIEKIKRENKWTQEDLVSRLKNDGLSLEKYKKNMKTELERIKVINYAVRSRILIRDEMIRKFYEENKDKFNEAAKVHLASIFLLPKNPDDEEETRAIEKKGSEILDRLKGGEDFKDLARRYSQGPGAEDGGYLGVFKLDELNPGLKKILEVIPEGGFSDLIIMPKGIQIIMVVKKDGGKAKSYEDVQDAIYGILYQEEIERRYQAWIKELRESSYTKIIF